MAERRREREVDASHEVWIVSGAGGWIVEVRPQHEAHLRRPFASLKDARGYAGRLRLTHWWKVVDTADGVTAI